MVWLLTALGVAATALWKLAPLAAAYFSYSRIEENLGQLKSFVGGEFHSLAISHPLLRPLIYASLVAFSLTILYGIVLGIFRSRGPKPLNWLVFSSLPLLLLTAIGYFGYIFYLQQADPVYASLAKLQTSGEVRAVEELHKIDHKKLAKNDPSYVEKAIKNGYSKAVYSSMFRVVPRSFLNKPDSTSLPPLFQAVREHNINAFHALWDCGRAEKNTSIMVVITQEVDKPYLNIVGLKYVIPWTVLWTRKVKESHDTKVSIKDFAKQHDNEIYIKFF